MWYRNNRNRIFQAMTLVEVLVAAAVMAIIFAVIVPQLRVAENSWDSKVSTSETLQNGRILIDHLNRNLSKAARITAVSGSTETNGYIEFIDNDANNVRYAINTINYYVEFGLIGNLNDLAGPVSQLLFTCYDGNDFTTPITDVNSIRYIKVETTLINPSALDQDMTFTTHAYIRSNTLPAPGGGITKLAEPWLEYDIYQGMESAICQIDQTHYICAYRGLGDDGFAVVLTVNTDTWQVSKGSTYEFDKKQGKTPALVQIDQTHYLCAYQGDRDDGFAVPLVVDTLDWSIYQQDPLEFDTDICIAPDLAKIDNTHYLCAYEGTDGDGFVNILKIDTSGWIINKLDTLEFDTSMGQSPSLAQIDQTHYLCAYTGLGGDGRAVVLTVDTGNWTISKETPFVFDILQGLTPSLSQIDSTHYLCSYDGPGNDGWTVVLTVNTGDWSITKQTPFEFDAITGQTPDLVQIDQYNYLCAYTGPSITGNAVLLTVDPSGWTISKVNTFEYDSSVSTTQNPDLAQIDTEHYICSSTGLGDDGFAGVLAISEDIRP